MISTTVKIEADGGITLPREVLDLVSLKEGDPILLEIIDGLLVIRKPGRKRKVKNTAGLDPQ